MDVSPRRSGTRPARTPGPGDVGVRYRLVDAADAAAEARAMRTLSEDERARAARFVFARDRASFVAAHALLRESLSEHEDLPPGAWTFAQRAHGKPVLADRHAGLDLVFNLAHTDGLVACAIGRGGDVGIDVERLRDDVRPMELACRFFSPSEVAGLEACAENERALRFIELWTLKESYVKAIGEGLSHPLDGFSFLLDGSSALRFETAAAGDARAWQFALFAPSGLHRMAVAVRPGQAEAVRINVRGDHATVAPVLRTSR